MATNSTVIISLCSQLCMCDGIVPLEPREWSDLAEKMISLGIQPANLMDFSMQNFSDIFGMTTNEAKRMQKLLNRTGSLSFELADLEILGIHVVTRADKEYPSKLKLKLKRQSPPLFYYAGDLSLLNNNCVGFVGSRSIEIDDAEFAKSTVKKVIENGFSITSGGAKGIDSISTSSALAFGGNAIEFLSDSMLRRIKSPEVYESIQNGKLLLASFVKPNTGFNVGNAMARNKFVYAQADGVVIVKSDYNKGGTWAGATENLKNGWCKTFCWDNKQYHGNQELIKMGAIPIDDSWSGILDQSEKKRPEKKPATELITGDQLCIFDI